MAQISKSIQAQYGLTANLIPVDVLKAIDQSELLDRLAYCTDLVRKAQKAYDPATRTGLSALARAALTAQPRAKTEAEAATMVVKAAAAPPGQAAAIRRAIAELQERHPAAPRRAVAAPVAKAKAAKDAPPVPVFDANGRLVGVVDPDDIIPVAGADAAAKPAQPAQAAQPPAAPAAGTAAPAAGVKARGASGAPVCDWTGRLVGAVRRADVTAPPSGRIAKSAAVSTTQANVYDARRRLVGTAPLARIVPLADLRAGRAARR